MLVWKKINLELECLAYDEVGRLPSFWHERSIDPLVNQETFSWRHRQRHWHGQLQDNHGRLSTYQIVSLLQKLKLKDQQIRLLIIIVYMGKDKGNVRMTIFQLSVTFLVIYGINKRHQLSTNCSTPMGWVNAGHHHLVTIFILGWAHLMEEINVWECQATSRKYAKYRIWILQKINRACPWNT